jgi:hypothetical protein
MLASEYKTVTATKMPIEFYKYARKPLFYPNKNAPKASCASST